MSNLKTFLKVIEKIGYPNSSVQMIADMVEYNLENLLPDLVDEVGEKKANHFVKQAINKMSTKDGIKISNFFDDPNEYAYIIIVKSVIDLDNDETTVLCKWKWGDTNIHHLDYDGNESYETIQTIGENIGMGEWGDYDELMDTIKQDCSKLMFDNCGFGIWWD